VFSEVDRKSLHIQLANEAYTISPAPSRESYLRIDKLIAVAQQTGCNTMHPSYGFLAENPALPHAYTEASITFVGPSTEAMEALRSKTAERQLARRIDVPTMPNTNNPTDKSQTQTLAQRLGYPVLLKAVTGGGGKGMQLVYSDAEFESAFHD